MPTFGKNFNTIWEIQVEDGSSVCSFKEKVEEGARYFLSLFQEPRGCPMQEILHVISKFPSVIYEEMNMSLSEEVLEPEVNGPIIHAKREESKVGRSYDIVFHGIL
jgi:hypothetical protein